jgi:hypothetical protein
VVGAGVGVATGHFQAGRQFTSLAAVMFGIASAVRSAAPARIVARGFMMATSSWSLAKPRISQRDRWRAAAEKVAAARHGGDGQTGNIATAREQAA